VEQGKRFRGRRDGLYRELPALLKEEFADLEQRILVINVENRVNGMTFALEQIDIPVSG
jgi:hypothetical protein